MQLYQLVYSYMLQNLHIASGLNILNIVVHFHFTLLTFSVNVVYIGAVRKCHVAKQATDMDINKHVIRWFNLASDRGGGRRDRQHR